VESYIILEEKLKLKKIKLSKLDDDLRITKEKFQKGMNENKGETVNSEDVSSTASLYVTLLHAKDLKPMDMNGSSNPYVIFKLGTQKATSSFKQSTLEPIWNEDFSFPVNSKNLDLHVEVWTHGRFGGEEIQGQLKIPLKDLSNQMKIERDFDLEMDNGTITLRLQFLYSKYKYYSQNFIKTEAQILRLQEDIHELNRYYDLFHVPFGILIYGEINSILDKKILQRSEDINSYAATSRRSVYMSPNFLKAPKGFAFKLESVIKGTFRKSNVEWSYYSLIMMYSVLICSAISLIMRSDFVGLFVGLALWILFINDKNKMDILKYLKLLIYTIFFTIIYDSAWLAIHYNVNIFLIIELLERA
jgi:hypothetical protein